jgi:hypothetical protein
MPTYEAIVRFLRDYRKLTEGQRAQFSTARKQFVDDLKTGQGFRPGLRIKRIQRTDDVWEMTWARDGRATWQYGQEQKPGEPHIIWRRIGTHDVLDQP